MSAAIGITPPTPAEIARWLAAGGGTVDQVARAMYAYWGCSLPLSQVARALFEKPGGLNADGIVRTFHFTFNVNPAVLAVVLRGLGLSNIEIARALMGGTGDNLYSVADDMRDGLDLTGAETNKLLNELWWGRA